MPGRGAPPAIGGFTSLSMDVLSLSVHLVLPLVLRKSTDRSVHGIPGRLGPLQPLLQVEATPHPPIQARAPEPPPPPGRLHVGGESYRLVFQV